MYGRFDNFSGTTLIKWFYWIGQFCMVSLRSLFGKKLFIQARYLLGSSKLANLFRSLTFRILQKKHNFGTYKAHQGKNCCSPTVIYSHFLVSYNAAPSALLVPIPSVQPGCRRSKVSRHISRLAALGWFHVKTRRKKVNDKKSHFYKETWKNVC